MKPWLASLKATLRDLSLARKLTSIGVVTSIVPALVGTGVLLA